MAMSPISTASTIPKLDHEVQPHLVYRFIDFRLQLLALGCSFRAHRITSGRNLLFHLVALDSGSEIRVTRSLLIGLCLQRACVAQAIVKLQGAEGNG